MGKIKYKIFHWGMKAKDFEKTFKRAEEFVNKKEVADVISITFSSFGIIVWYRALKVKKKK